MVSASKLIRRLANDERGQDLVEYGLLVSIFALGCLVIFPDIEAGLRTAFGNWGTSAVDSSWIPDAPLP